MNKKMKAWNWHIILLLILLILFSARCWINFAKSVVTEFVSKITPASTVETAHISESNTAASTAQNARPSGSVKQIALRIDQIDRLLDTMDTTWYQHMYKKSLFSKMDSLFTYCTTSEIASQQVLKGSNGWLFYKSTTDGNTIGDYEGTNFYSQEEIDAMLNIALSVQEEVEKRGIQFALLLAPNKENVYAQYMPDSYTYSPVSRTSELHQILAKNGVNSHFPKQALQDNAKNHQLYYYGDTHWNQLGAYVGIQEVLRSWCIEIPDLASQKIVSRPQNPNNMDLVRIAGLQPFLNNDLEYEFSGYGSAIADNSNEEFNKQNLIHTTNTNAKVNASLLLVGDSFRLSMTPVLSELFSDFYVIHRSDYSNDLLDKINPDYLIVELVERHSNHLKYLDL